MCRTPAPLPQRGAMSRSAPYGDPPHAARASAQHGVVTSTQLREHGLSQHRSMNLGDIPRWRIRLDRRGAETRRQSGPPSATHARGGAGRWSGSEALLLVRSAELVGLQGCALRPVRDVGHDCLDAPAQFAVTVHRVRFLPDRWTAVTRCPVGAPGATRAAAVRRGSRSERASGSSDRLWSDAALLGHVTGTVPERGSAGGVGRLAGLRRYFDRRGAELRPPDSGLESRARIRSLRAERDRVRSSGRSRRRRAWTGRVDFRHQYRLPGRSRSRADAPLLARSIAQSDRNRLRALRTRRASRCSSSPTRWCGPLRPRPPVIAAVLEQCRVAVLVALSGRTVGRIGGTERCARWGQGRLVMRSTVASRQRGSTVPGTRMNSSTPAASASSSACSSRSPCHTGASSAMSRANSRPKISR